MIRPKLLYAILAVVGGCTAERLIESKSLNPCMDKSALAAKFFHTVFTPDNNTLAFNIEGDSKISANVTLEIDVFAYGHNFYAMDIDPCDNPDLKGICPMNAGALPGLNSNIILKQSDVDRVPSMSLSMALSSPLPHLRMIEPS
jgi:hypothetical protein